MTLGSGLKYLDATEANLYFAERLNSETWDLATSADKLKALIQATSIIDKLTFVGAKTEEDQDLQFPRDGSEEIPDDIKIACCEIAISLLSGVDINQEIKNIQLVKAEYSTIRSTYDRSVALEYLSYGIPCYEAWARLIKYILDSRTINISRVS